MQPGSLMARLRAAFLEDLEEQLRAMDAELLGLEADPGGAERLRALFRAAHTLKGAARAANLTVVEEVCHLLEEHLEAARAGRAELGPAEFRGLFQAVDALRDAGTRLRADEPLEGSPVEALAARLRAEGLRVEAPAMHAEETPAPEAAPVPERAGERMRVDAGKLDALLRSAGELMLARQRVASRLPELRALSELLARVEAEQRRTARAARTALERAGAGSGAALALAALEDGLRRAAREASRLAASAAADARALSHAAGAVATEVHELRLRPFADACEALPRVVRDVAEASGKEARLVVQGGEVEADRGVIEGVRDALLHLVRNAVDHGIEPPAEREARGKPRAGTVTLSARVRESRLVVTVRDDGRGIDLDAVRAALERQGLPVPTGDEELARTLFRGGLTTREEATLVSGRGVGLDAVQAALERVRGRVDVSWTEGAGAAFVLEMPLTLATLRVLLVRVGEHVLALPSADVDHLERIDPERVRRVEGRDVILTPTGPIPLAPLGRILGPPLPAGPVAAAPVAVVLRSAARRAAVVVDEPLAEREVVVRPLERREGPLAHLAGASLLETGEVALVLESASLVDAALTLPGGASLAATEAAAAPAARRVLVVDDSITTRTLEQSTLEAAGYEVVTAVDGEEGWRRLQEEPFDVVVSDVEMPRMDGIALTEAIRASKRLSGLPVVLVTSLDSQEHRGRGLEAGADAYVGKSSFDQQTLLDVIRQLIG